MLMVYFLLPSTGLCALHHGIMEVSSLADRVETVIDRLGDNFTSKLENAAEKVKDKPMVSKITVQIRTKLESDWPWVDEELGKLDVTDAWYKYVKRPVNFVPLSRHRIGTRFFIHTRFRRNQDTDHEVSALQDDTLENTGFNPTIPTIFIIHGFIENGMLPWIVDMAQELLDYGDYNVFRVDWGAGSVPPYEQAAGNTRVVGLEIGRLLNWLIEFHELVPADVQLIGYSLGSHIAGYAGEKIPGLGRITGLDPAGLYFADMPEFVRLDESDAIFVDNYHTDGNRHSILALGYGTMQPMGNIDFYSNGGRFQPGCDPFSILNLVTQPGDNYGDLKKLTVCSHERAIELYRDTITHALQQSCTYTAYECDNYEHFTVGFCTFCEDSRRCSPVGIQATEYTHKKRVNVKMYFDTEENIPSC
ncbi:unnamed protein product [Meganyctiphanes norvegica]|uniref:Lipase domain-containing protein n=1 Tax=Meganyctiphanes norvegica TaxID=48144 RepID=A0AAV2ST22_MEGNR